MHSSIWFIVYFMISLNLSLSALSHKIPRLGGYRHKTVDNLRDSTPPELFGEDLETYFYNQTLDHFNYRIESYVTFQQRYVVSFKYWGGANTSAPIFVDLGEEETIDGDIEFNGFIPENAPSFKALQVYIEHRFYGMSIPFGLSMKDALKNESTRGYFNSAQALADYAEVILYLKKSLGAENSPVIVIGASYGGMLSSWFRLKYPHVALGALASSAPILYFEGIAPTNGYFSVVDKDFKEASETCHETIRLSWSEIDKVASEPEGLAILSQKFKTCTPLTNTQDLKNFLETIYCSLAQYGAPPRYPVAALCGGIDGASGEDTLGRIFSGVVAHFGNISCYPIGGFSEDISETDLGWSWQTCSEMVMPIGPGLNDTMFQPDPFNLTSFTQDCQNYYGVTPRPHWATTYYGGQEIKTVLKKFGSNIIFSNGLRDPYSSAGVLENLSDSLHAVYTVNGSHCLDLSRTRPTDPEWLLAQRNTEIEIIRGWLAEYYDNIIAGQ